MEAEEQYTKQEDERLQKEVDHEERERRENQEHEPRMMELLGRMFGGGSHTYGTPCEFENDTYHRSY